MDAKRKPFYGYYALGWIHIIVIPWTTLGILIAAFLHQTIGIAVLCFGAYMYLTYWMGMALSKPNQSYDLSWILQLRGDEQVLDAGCGLGRVTVGVAKLLKEGKVIGIDIWDKLDIGSISPQRAHQNAEIEGVRDRVDFKTGNVLDIPFPDSSFDLVTASTVLLALWSREARLKALTEMHRVLRPGGRFLLMETLRNPGTLIMCPAMAWRFLTKGNCISLLNEAGFVNLKEGYRDIMGHFLVEKPRSREEAGHA
jgi:SAM-dependent methyltransferase